MDWVFTRGNRLALDSLSNGDEVLTTSCVFKESMPMQINVCWRRLANQCCFVPVLRIASTMHSRIAVSWHVHCLPINSRVSCRKAHYNGPRWLLIILYQSHHYVGKLLLR